MATHSSIFAWEIPRTEETAGYMPSGCKESDMREHARKCITLTQNLQQSPWFPYSHAINIVESHTIKLSSRIERISYH